MTNNLKKDTLDCHVISSAKGPTLPYFLTLSRKTLTFQKYESMPISICNDQMEKQIFKANNKLFKGPLLLS